MAFLNLCANMCVKTQLGQKVDATFVRQGIANLLCKIENEYSIVVTQRVDVILFSKWLN